MTRGAVKRRPMNVPRVRTLLDFESYLYLLLRLAFLNEGIPETALHANALPEERRVVLTPDEDRNDVVR